MDEPGKRDIEAERLANDSRKKNWKRSDPYLSER